MKRVRVVVGVIITPEDNIIISKRHEHLHQGGLWEFPGGKVEDGETESQALHRELHEEIGIEITSSEYWFTISHDYPDKKVELLIYKVTAYDGKLGSKEGQLIKEVPVKQLADYDFPAANQEIIDKLTKIELPL